MKLLNLIRKPFVAAILGAAVIALPVSALYIAGATRAVATPAALTAPVPVAGPTIALPDFSSMVQRYGPAVVNISVVTKVSAMNSQSGDEEDSPDNGNGNGNGNNPFGPNSPFAPFFRGLPFQMPQPGPVHGEGSGFIIRADGVIMTNAHVVNGASEVTVRLTDRREYTAKVIGVDARSDIAMLKIAAKDLPTVRIGDSRGLKVGEWVLAIGAPFGFENSATAGIVSAKGRTLPDSGYVPFIQTDVPINPGNSGGPLFNMRGEVVGVNSQIYSRSGGYMGVSFSIPIDVAMQVGQQLQTTGHVAARQARRRHPAGDPGPGGLVRPAAARRRARLERGKGRAGRKGRRRTRRCDPENQRPGAAGLQRTAGGGREHQPRDRRVRLQIWRNHASRDFTVKLGALEDKRTAANAAAPAQGGKLGLAVRPLTADEQRQANISGGLVVERARGPAAEAGIQQGDVVLAANGAPVTSAQGLRNAVEKSKGHIALLIQRGDTRLFVPVRVG